MDERKKKIAALCLIVAGLVLFGYNFLRSSEAGVHGKEVSQPVHLDSLYAIESSEPIASQKADIMALFVLKSDVCPPCVNNTLDYINLINKIEESNIATTALFVENQPPKVHRFVNVTKLSIPYRIATKKELPEPLKDTMQELLFIDKKSKEIFYRLIITGNVTSGLSYKRKLLTQALSSKE